FPKSNPVIIDAPPQQDKNASIFRNGLIAGKGNKAPISPKSKKTLPCPTSANIIPNIAKNDNATKNVGSMAEYLGTSKVIVSPENGLRKNG
ncbi:MAG: hypothetical protein AAB116_25230, partial [Candidatus Poribacteria bacterium]